MSNFNSPATQWHLSDRALTPILSTAKIASPTKTQSSTRDQDTHLQSFNALTTTAIAAFDAASRLGLGVPQRIIVETSSGPVILHSFINPPSPPKSQSASEHETEQTNIEGDTDGTNEQDILEQTREGLRPLSATTEGGSERATIDNAEVEVGREVVRIGNTEISTNGVVNGVDEPIKEIKQEEEDSILQRSPLLIASVFAPTLGEAKKTAAVLEQTAREIQRELLIVEEEEEAAEEATVVEEGSQAEVANNDEDG